MAKIKKSPPQAKEVTVTYDLFELPTAQHKAGLAGLILQIRYMERTKRNYPAGAIPTIAEVTPTSATVQFTEESVQGLFDAIYQAELVEVETAKPWKDVDPKRVFDKEEEDPKTKKVKKTKRFVYDVVQPAGKFLADAFPDMDARKGWLKLWREMIWNIPRGIPMTRIPYQQRHEDKPCKEGKDAWQELLKVQAAKVKNAFFTTEVAGALWLGAQAANAESVPFVGRGEQNLLLHFWPFTVLVYAPQQINSDGETDFVGFVLAIPEVSDLDEFVHEYPLMLAELGTETRGYRPSEAVIDVAAEGALSFLEHLARLAAHKAEKDKFGASVASVEYVHLAKFGNNVKSLAAGRVPFSPPLLHRYRQIVGDAHHPSRFRNPFFRRALILALLNSGTGWYEPLGPMLAQLPWPHFVRSEDSPRNLPWFWQDAANMFDDLLIQHDATLRRHRDMINETPSAGSRPETPREMLIYRLVQRYVLRKTEDKTGYKLEELKQRKTPEGKADFPKDWNEAKERIASSLFLELRSRREQAFVDHFTATFCSVKQFLPDEDFQIVAQALLSERENVKTLTLLALSANS